MAVPLRGVRRLRRAHLPSFLLLSILIALTAFGLSCEDKTIVQGDTIELNPVPQIASLSPSEAVFGGSSFTLTVTGSRFIQGSVVVWNGAERATTYLSGSEITATILATDLEDNVLLATAEEGVEEGVAEGDAKVETEGEAVSRHDDTLQVWVRNPEPGGGTSNALSFIVRSVRPVPTIYGLSPPAGVVGDPDMDITVSGSGFHEESVVRWDQSDLATTYVSDFTLTAVVPAANLASETTAEITVFNPTPGGGTSNIRTFSVVPPNPVPTITSLAPSTVTAGGTGAPTINLTVTGMDFVPGAQVLWNGQPRLTSFVSEAVVDASIPVSDIADGGSAQVSVSNPAPGGGVSNELTITIENPVPSLTSISPASAAAGASGTTLTVDGSGFVISSVVRWNGQDRTTTFVNSSRLRADITAADLQTAGSAEVSVFNPPPVGGTSVDQFSFTIYNAVSIETNDIIYDPVSGYIFASVPSTGGGIGNTITAIDPATGQILSSVFVGSEPNPLAVSDDGQYIYVGLDGAAAIRRYIIATQTADIQFDLGTGTFGPLSAEDIEVIPGSPGSVVVSTMRSGVSPRHGGVFVYDDGVRRTQGTQDHTGSNRIEPSASPTRFYGYNNETTEFGFRHLDVSASGVTQGTVQRDLISGFGVDITYDGGKVFSTRGVIIDPESMIRLGTLSTSGAMVPDASIGRVFFLNAGKVVVYNSDTFVRVGEVAIDAVGSYSRPLIRVGSDGLAFRADNNTVVILQHPLFTGP